MSFDYNVFTKAELVNFLNKNERNYKYIALPYQVMLEDKMNKIMRQMEESVRLGEFLTEQLKKRPKDVEFARELVSNNNEWLKLNKEYDKLSNMLFKGD